MNSTLEQISAHHVKLTINLPGSEVAGYFQKVADRLAPQLKIPGFRHGKAPRKVVERHVGTAYLAQEALELALSHSYYRAVQQHDLKPIGQPKTELVGKDGNFEQAGLQFTAEVAVLPEVKLGDYQKLKIKPVKSAFSEDLVAETLEQLRKSRATQQVVDRPANLGDKVEIDFEGTRKGQSIEGAKSANHPLTLGEGSFIPGFEEKVVGLGPNQQKTFTIKFPKDYHAKELAGQKVDFAVTMKQVQENALPELDDRFAKQFGAKNLDDLKKRLRDNLEKEKTQEATARTEQAVVDAVVGQVTIDLPDLLIEQELDRMLVEFKEDLSRQGATYEQYLQHLKKTEEDIRKSQRPTAQQRLKMSLVLNAVQEAEKIKPTAAQINAELAHQREHSHLTDDAVQMESPEFRSYIERILGNRQTLARLVELTVKE